MIKGFRFTNQLANAEVDARIHQEFLNKNDGIFYGMNLSKTNSSVTISEGLCEIAGRPVAVIDNETVAVSSNNLYCLLVLEIDLSKESTKDTFMQAYFKLVTSSSAYPSVTQQDINKFNKTENIYQLEFARFRSGTNGITDFKDTRIFLNFSGIYKKVKEDCDNVIKQIKQELIDTEVGQSKGLLEVIFPIGSTYVTQNNTNPSEILKFGTWERLKGKVCLGLDEDDTDLNVIGKTGGEKTHKLTLEETPSHSHEYDRMASLNNQDTEFHVKFQQIMGWNVDSKTESTKTTGGDQPHNNMQPYEVVGYMWIRRA